MRITPVTAFKPAFGFDKRLNRELKNELAKYPDEDWAKSLLDLNSFCNNTENIIRKIEKDGCVNSSVYEDYVDMLCNCKEILIGNIAMTTTELNYADRECRHYYDEYVKRGSQKDDWRKKLCDYIVGWTVHFSIEPQGKNNDAEERAKLINKMIDPLKNCAAQKSSGAKKSPSYSKNLLSNDSLLEQYVPSQDSPKGFSDIAGMEKLKKSLTEGILNYIRDPEGAKLDFEEYGKEMPKAVLLYGPPGCGKTYITQALAAECESPVFMLNISKVGSKYINETAQNIKKAFDEAIRASKKSDTPCILFLDEIDSVGFNRTAMENTENVKQVSTLLQSMDNALSSNIIIIGATNKYDILDPAVRRRFDSKTFVDTPDEEAICDLLKKQLKPLKKGHTLMTNDEDILKIAKLLKGYSNKSICIITKEAALNALGRNRAEISVIDFETAIKNTAEEKPDKKLYMSEDKKKKSIGF